jgi:hypothetical protein
MSSLPGRLGMVYIANGAGGYSLIGEAKTWRFDTDVDLIESNAIGDPWKTYLMLPKKWECTIEGNFDPTDFSIFPFIGGLNQFGAAGILLYPDRTNTSHFYMGSIWAKLSVEVNITSVSKFTLGGTGEGVLTIV